MEEGVLGGTLYIQSVVPTQSSYPMRDGQAIYVLGRPGKCRPRKTIAKQSKKTSTGSINVGAKLARSLRFKYDVK